KMQLCEMEKFAEDFQSQSNHRRVPKTGVQKLHYGRQAGSNQNCLRNGHGILSIFRPNQKHQAEQHSAVRSAWLGENSSADSDSKQSHEKERRPGTVFSVC